MKVLIYTVNEVVNLKDRWYADIVIEKNLDNEYEVVKNRIDGVNRIFSYKHDMLIYLESIIK